MADDGAVLTFVDLKKRKRWPFTREHTMRLWKAGEFPKPFKAGAHGRNLWLESEIDAYLAERQSGARHKDKSKRA
jgi:predicted DNA-binding transcriptional regulator AlpA